MRAVVIGCGRVGSAVALQLSAEGWDVTAVDESEEVLARLGCPTQTAISFLVDEVRACDVGPPRPSVQADA